MQRPTTSDTTARREALAGRLAWMIPSLVAVILLVPRLLSPQFGLLDDGNTLRTARLLSAGDWQLPDSMGRSRPLYWIFWSAPRLVIGAHPFWYFLVNLIVLVSIVAALVGLARSLGLRPFPAGVTATVFVLSGPGIENFYTLSKGEPPQVLLLLIALGVAIRYGRDGRRPTRIGALAVATLLILLAGLTKETAIVMAPIGLAWFAAVRMARPHPEGEGEGPAWEAACLVSVLGVLAFLLYRWLSVSSAEADLGYATGYEFSISRLLDSGSRWAAWLIHDFLFLLPLGFLPILWRLQRRALARADVLLGSLVWMGAWLAPFLLWVFVADYYLLPFSVGAAFFAGWLLTQAVAVLRTSGPGRWATGGLVLVSTLLFCGTLANNSTMARVQLAVDAANADVVEFLATEVPQQGKVILNIQDPNEYVTEMGLHLAELYDRTDVAVTYLDPEALPLLTDQDDVYIASPSIGHQVLLSARLGVDEPAMRRWNASMADFFQNSAERVYHSQREVRVLVVDPARLFCPLLAKRLESEPDSTGLPIDSITRYCQTGALVESRLFSYGWDVWRLSSPAHVSRGCVGSQGLTGPPRDFDSAC